MRTVFDFMFNVVGFIFKMTFWFIGLLIALLIGSCPD